MIRSVCLPVMGALFTIQWRRNGETRDLISFGYLSERTPS
jgi:hypothetical protein